jgi:hypothetical protein
MGINPVDDKKREAKEKKIAAKLCYQAKLLEFERKAFVCNLRGQYNSAMEQLAKQYGVPSCLLPKHALLSLKESLKIPFSQTFTPSNHCPNDLPKPAASVTSAPTPLLVSELPLPVVRQVETCSSPSRPASGGEMRATAHSGQQQVVTQVAALSGQPAVQPVVTRSSPSRHAAGGEIHVAALSGQQQVVTQVAALSGQPAVQPVVTRSSPSRHAAGGEIHVAALSGQQQVVTQVAALSGQPAVQPVVTRSSPSRHAAGSEIHVAALSGQQQLVTQAAALSGQHAMQQVVARSSPSMLAAKGASHGAVLGMTPTTLACVASAVQQLALPNTMGVGLSLFHWDAVGIGVVSGWPLLGMG